MRIVSDSSPLLNLAIIERLDLLEAEFGCIIVPAAVVRELALDSDLLGAAQLRAVIPGDWIQVVEVADIRTLAMLREGLDPGEAEAIALALQLGCETVLLDEPKARAVASQHGLVVSGVLGVLLRSKRAGRLEAVAPLIHLLRTEAAFRVADSLVASILREAGEV